MRKRFLPLNLAFSPQPCVASVALQWIKSNCFYSAIITWKCSPRCFAKKHYNIQWKCNIILCLRTQVCLFVAYKKQILFKMLHSLLQWITIVKRGVGRGGYSPNVWQWMQQVSFHLAYYLLSQLTDSGTRGQGGDEKEGKGAAAGEERRRTIWEEGPRVRWLR